MTSQDPDPTQSTPIAPSNPPVDDRPAPSRAPASPPPFTPPPTQPTAWAQPTTAPSTPPTAWQQPTTPPAPTPSSWQPPPATPPPTAWQKPPSSDYGRNGAVVFGVILVVIGLWFFASTTLGIDLPDVNWGALWPLLLIGLGAWIVLGAMGRRR